MPTTLVSNKRLRTGLTALQHQLNRMFKQDLDTLNNRNLNTIDSPTSAYDFNYQDLTNVGDLSLNDNNQAETKLTLYNDNSGGASVAGSIKLNAVGDSFAALGSLLANDFAYYSNNTAGPGFILDVSNHAIKPFSTGARVDIGASSPYSGITESYFGDLYISNAYLNNNSTNTFFTLTSSSTVFRAEAFGSAAYAGMGTSSGHNLILFTNGAGGATVWLDTSKNVYPHNTGTSLGTVAKPWENIRGNNYNPEGGQFNIGTSASGNTVLEIGNPSNASGVVAIDFNAGISSAVDFVYRIINGSDKVLSFQERGGNTILNLASQFSYFSNQLTVGNTSTIDSNIDLVVDGSTLGYPMLLQQYGNDKLTVISRGARGTEGTPTAIQDGDYLASWEARGHDGTNFTTGPRGFWRYVANGNWSGSNNGTILELGVTSNGSTSPITALVIGSGGHTTCGSTAGTGAYNIYAANFYQDSTIGNLTKTKMVTIGDADTNYTFTANADQLEQIITLTNILPAYAQIDKIQIRCIETVAGGTVTSINLAVGTTSGGEEVLAAANLTNAGDINEDNLIDVASSSSLRNLYLQCNINGGDWNTLTAGQFKLCLTYTDNAGL